MRNEVEILEGKVENATVVRQRAVSTKPGPDQAVLAGSKVTPGPGKTATEVGPPALSETVVEVGARSGDVETAKAGLKGRGVANENAAATQEAGSAKQKGTVTKEKESGVFARTKKIRSSTLGGRLVEGRGSPFRPFAGVF